jgi:hypothetical protein
VAEAGGWNIGVGCCYTINGVNTKMKEKIIIPSFFSSNECENVLYLSVEKSQLQKGKK